MLNEQQERYEEHWNSITQDNQMKIQKNYRKIIQKVVKSHNNAPSNRAPKIDDIINASPFEILHDDALMDEMEKVLKDRRTKQ